jgi:flagellar hook-associated protein 2
VPGISMDSVSNLSPEFQKAFGAAMTADRKPIQQLEDKKAVIESKVNLLNDLNSKVDSLKQSIPALGSPFAIRDLSFTSDDDKIITGSADKNSTDKGKYAIEVLQLAGSASALSNALPDKTETKLGSGYLSFTTKSGETKEIFIDDENATLEGMAKVINTSGTGLKATVINDNSGETPAYRLMLRAEGVGTQSDVQFPEIYFSGGEEELYLESIREASNAVVRYQGFEIQSPTNELKDIIPGATINLKGTTGMGKPLTITIEQDVPKTTAKMKDIVDKVNQVLTFIQNQNKMDEKTDTSKTLGGDYGIRLAEDRIRSALQQNYIFEESSRKYRSLTDLGIQFNKQGTLTLDEKKFQTALEANFDDVVSLMVGEGDGTRGIMPALMSAVNSISSAGGGVLTNQLQNYNGQIRSLDNTIATKEKQSEARAEQLKGKLAAAQSALSSMKGQAAYFQGTSGSGGAPGS